MERYGRVWRGFTGHPARSSRDRAKRAGRSRRLPGHWTRMLTTWLHAPGPLTPVVLTRNPTIVNGVRFAIIVFPWGVEGASWNVVPPSVVHCQLKHTFFPLLPARAVTLASRFTEPDGVPSVTLRMG